MRNEFVSCIKKRFVGAHRDSELLANHANGLLEQLNLVLAKTYLLPEGHDLILLIKQSETKAGEIILSASYGRPVVVDRSVKAQ